MPSETLTTDELIELWRAAGHMHEHAIRIARLSGEKRDREAEEAWYRLAGKCERMAAAGLRAAHQERDADARRLTDDAHDDDCHRNAPTVLDVKGCARCGRDHSVRFWRLTNPSDEWDHWGMCPMRNEPILMRIVTEEATPLRAYAKMAAPAEATEPHRELLNAALAVCDKWRVFEDEGLPEGEMGAAIDRLYDAMGAAESGGS